MKQSTKEKLIEKILSYYQKKVEFLSAEKIKMLERYKSQVEDIETREARNKIKKYYEEF